MASWLVRLDYNDGAGWQDITALVYSRSFRRERTFHNRLKPTVNTLKFRMAWDPATINELLTATTDPKINVQKDGADYFTGFVRPNHKSSAASNVEHVTVECVDEGFYLKKKINRTFSLSNYYISDTTTTSQSIIHTLLVDWYGLSSARVEPGDILTAIDYVVRQAKETTYWALLEKLLWEHGYVFYFDESGVFRTRDVYPASLSTSAVFDNTNMVGQLQVNKREMGQEGVELTWWAHEQLTDVLIFNDTTGGTEDQHCNIPLDPGEYYPNNAGTRNVYSEYSVKDRELIIAQNIDWSHIVKDAVIDITEQQNFYTRALLTFYNSGASAGSITRLQVRGDAVVKGDRNISKYYIVVGTEKIEEITGEWIQNSTAADRLIVGLARWYRYSDFVYNLKSRADYAPGDVVTIDETLYGITNKVRVVQRTDNEFTGLSEYLCEGIAEYTAQTTESEGAHEQPASLAPGETADNPTEEEVILVDDTGTATLLGTQEFVVDGNLIISGGVAKSAGYLTGSDGWLLDSAGNTELNNALVRGTIDAYDGKVGGFIIKAARLYAGESAGARIQLDDTEKRFAVYDSLNNIKVALGYLGNIAGYTDTQYGLYIADGNTVRFEGGGELVGQDYTIASDGALVIDDGSGGEIGRYGSLGSGEIGFYIGDLDTGEGIRYSIAQGLTIKGGLTVDDVFAQTSTLIDGGSSADTSTRTFDGGSSSSVSEREFNDDRGVYMVPMNFVTINSPLFLKGGVMGDITSDDYEAGVKGYKISLGGDVEFNDGTFRGELDAATGSFAGSLDAATGSFAGSLDAATGSFAGSLDAATGSFAGSLDAATGNFLGTVKSSWIESGPESFSNIVGLGWEMYFGTLDSSGEQYVPLNSDLGFRPAAAFAYENNAIYGYLPIKIKALHPSGSGAVEVEGGPAGASFAVLVFYRRPKEP